MSNTTSTRRSAFARKSANQSSGNKAPMGPVRINKKFCEDFRKSVVLDDTLKDVVSGLDASISFSVSASGGSSEKMLGPAGEILADDRDLSSICQINSFIANERKQASKESTSVILEAGIAAVVSEVPNIIPGGVVVKLPKQFEQIYRAINAQMNTLAINVTAMENHEAQGDSNEMVKNYLLASAKNIRDAAGRYVCYRAMSESDEPQKLNDFIHRANTLGYVFKKLTDAKLSMNQAGFQIKHLLFPKDPTKGLVVTYGELMTAGILKNQGGIFGNMDGVLHMFKDEVFLKIFLNEERSLTAPDGDLYKIVKNIPIMVVPPFVEHDEIADIVQRKGMHGSGWNVGSTLTPQDTLRFLGTFHKRAFYFAIPKLQYKESLLEQIIPSFVNAPTNGNMAERLAHTIRNNKDAVTTWCDHVGELDGDDHREFMFSLFKEYLQIPDIGVYATRLRVVTDADGIESVTSIEPGTTAVSGVDSWSRISTSKLRLGNRAENQATLERVMDKIPGKKVQEIKPILVSKVRTPISARAADLIDDLKRRRYVRLAIALDNFFRGFLKTEVQARVAELIHAKLDWHLQQPVNQAHDENRALFLDDFIDEDIPADQAQQQDEEIPQTPEDPNAAEDDPDAAT